jgi:hypothetical protein
MRHGDNCRHGDLFGYIVLLARYLCATQSGGTPPSLTTGAHREINHHRSCSFMACVGLLNQSSAGRQYWGWTQRSAHRLMQ